MTRLSDVYLSLKNRTKDRSLCLCGTPNGIYLRHEREPNVLILLYRFDKYEVNHRRVVQEIPKCLCIHCNRLSIV